MGLDYIIVSLLQECEKMSADEIDDLVVKLVIHLCEYRDYKEAIEKANKIIEFEKRSRSNETNIF